MEPKTNIINIITHKLPFKLVRPLYNEFRNRLSDIHWQLENKERYQILNNHIETIEVLLAITIFHKRFLANLDGAITFHKKVTNYGNVDNIRIGSYDFSSLEMRKILAAQIEYSKLKKKFHIPNDLVEYTETSDFIYKVWFMLVNDENNGRSKGIEDDLPL